MRHNHQRNDFSMVGMKKAVGDIFRGLQNPRVFLSYGLKYSSVKKHTHTVLICNATLPLATAAPTASHTDKDPIHPVHC